MAHIYSPKISSDSMVLCVDSANPRSYPGSGTSWLDLSGNKNDFSMTSITFDPSFALGSFLFNGTNASAIGPNVSLGQYGTLNVWFQQTASTVNKGLFGISNGTNSAYFYIGGSSGTTIAISNGGSAVPQYVNEVSIPANRQTSWNMATYTWSDSTVTVSINAGAPATTTGYSFTRSGQAYIGVYPNQSSTSYFNGYISVVQLYSRVLTQAEITANYYALAMRFPNASIIF